MLHILQKGLFATLQTLPQSGWRSFGLSPRGPMDTVAHQAVNALLGNPPTALVMEMHFPTPRLQFDAATSFALAGGDFAAALNGKPIPLWQVHQANKGDQLRFGSLQSGFRCYLGIAGGFSAKLNRYDNYLIQNGESLLTGHPSEKAWLDKSFDPVAMTAFYRPNDSIACMPGPEYNYLTDEAKAVFVNSALSISPSGNRMGLPLQCPAALATHPHEPLLSGAVAMGTVQLLPNGQCLVLMADHNTTGGYPRIATVLESEWPKLAQLRPNQPFRWRLVTPETASEKYISFKTQLDKLLCIQSI
jgi:antagonist of KipI